jgi:hypothetical protein
MIDLLLKQNKLDFGREIRYIFTITPVTPLYLRIYAHFGRVFYFIITAYRALLGNRLINGRFFNFREACNEAL